MESRDWPFFLLVSVNIYQVYTTYVAFAVDFYSQSILCCPGGITFFFVGGLVVGFGHFFVGGLAVGFWSKQGFKGALFRSLLPGFHHRRLLCR